MLQHVSAHFSSANGHHHVDDLRGCLAGVLNPHQLHLFDNMLQRVETVAEAAAAKVCGMACCTTSHRLSLLSA